MINTIFLGVFSLVFTVLFCFFRARKACVFTLCLKTIASICFVLCAIFSIYSVGMTNINLFILVGLILGLIGDIMLDLKIAYKEEGNQYFVAGTTFFAIGHIFYFVAVLLYNIHTLPNNLLWNILISLAFAILFTLAILLLHKKLGLDFGKHIYLCMGYSLILSFMMAFSISIAIFVPMFWIFAAGMILFLLSDLVLSMQYFGSYTQKVWIYVNHLLYYAAQVLLAVQILYLAI